MEKNIKQQNDGILSMLNPSILWQHFGVLCTTPRGSSNEAEIADYIVSLSQKGGYVVKRDELHNVIVYLPASPGLEHLPLRCLQSHTDMVLAKAPGVENSFPIELQYSDDRKLRATGTTLGADNGMGASSMMALISDDTIPHGPLELVFTVQEETGLTGAEKLDYTQLKSKMVFNLDSEEEDTLCVGCAGGEKIIGRFSPTFLDFRNLKGTCEMYHITLSGFTGGHSGVEIGLGRGNAIRALAKLLIGFDEASLIDFKGGEAMNAIPRDAEAVITISSDKVEALSALVREFNKNSTANYPNDKALCMIQKLDTTTATKMFDAQSQKRFLTLLAKIPNGVISFESANPKLVRSSSNIGFVETKNNIVEIIILFRSSVERGLNDVESVIKDLFEVAGASVEIKAKFYPWEPQFDTDLLKFTVKTYKKIYQREPKVETIHAGLECAPFYQNMPGVQIVSFGPDMGDVHTPDEWVDVDSVERFWNFLLALIQSA